MSVYLRLANCINAGYVNKHVGLTDTTR